MDIMPQVSYGRCLGDADAGRALLARPGRGRFFFSCVAAGFVRCSLLQRTANLARVRGRLRSSSLPISPAASELCLLPEDRTSGQSS